ncbi:unnamed protein product [Auanema sp. JU1783]|nr:unnamed protein product [Auanema sp. JU1783]
MTDLVELRCAGGTSLSTTKNTLSRVAYSRLATDQSATQHSDPNIIRILLDALRRPDMRIVTPERFSEWSTLAKEAKNLGLQTIVDTLTPSTIVVACHAALSTGRLNPEVTFRKVLRVVISGKASICRSVFGDSLNDCRDGGGTDFEEDRYTSRLFLKHNNLEKAFDTLASKGFVLVHSNTFAPSSTTVNAAEDSQFIHHSQYIFQRDFQKNLHSEAVQPALF